MSKKYPFKNLAFQGGGTKTYAYHGALMALEKHGVLDQIERVVGTSAGAMLAAVISFRRCRDDGDLCRYGLFTDAGHGRYPQ